MKDPTTGKFAKGNPGRPKGSKNVRTLQWEDLGVSITGHHAHRFTELLDELWESADTTERIKAADLFLRTLDYFKPKLQRIQGAADAPRFIPTLVIHEDRMAYISEDWPGPIIEITREVIPATQHNAPQVHVVDLK